eukprot:TRINITY_DN6520_c0_g1_i4.p2 TRINITY_DN6520_c0_g1~~TRINITY_DN6520_c0_g1_i4.p2  ORF type:complete len:120 (+),score=10.01 TRINITY_DN6520_c0_g1_i4:274-633(+)
MDEPGEVWRPACGRRSHKDDFVNGDFIQSLLNHSQLKCLQSCVRSCCLTDSMPGASRILMSIGSIRMRYSCVKAFATERSCIGKVSSEELSKWKCHKIEPSSAGHWVHSRDGGECVSFV